MTLPDATADTDLARDAERLHAALGELLRVYQFRDRDRICCHDVSVTQCYALEVLVMAGPSTLNDLAARLYLDKSTASRVVGALERKGYTRRSPHPRDGRAVLLGATPEGRELHRVIEGELLAEERRLLADFDPAVRRSLTELVGRLAHAAAARIEAGGGTCCLLS